MPVALPSSFRACWDIAFTTMHLLLPSCSFCDSGFLHNHKCTLGVAIWSIFPRKVRIAATLLPITSACGLGEWCKPLCILLGSTTEEHCTTHLFKQLILIAPCQAGVSTYWSFWMERLEVFTLAEACNREDCWHDRYPWLHEPLCKTSFSFWGFCLTLSCVIASVLTLLPIPAYVRIRPFQDRESCGFHLTSWSHFALSVELYQDTDISDPCRYGLTLRAVPSLTSILHM